MGLTNKAKDYIKKNPAKSAKELAEKLNANIDDVRQYLDNINKPLPLKRKILFYAITFSVPILFFLFVEGMLRGVNYLGNTNLFVDPGIKNQEYYMPNRNFAARYFFYTRIIPNPPADLFLQHKPENGYRIFAMGGSSAAGYPYGFNGIFSRVVKDVLEDAMPEKKIEVVNVGISAISSYTLFDQVDEIMAQEPDAIMIYAGHNEFYGALGVGSNENLGAFPAFVRFYLKLQRFKTFLFLRDILVKSGQWISGFFTEKDNYTDPSATLMERVINSQSIELNGPQYTLAMHQFESNMQAIVSKFEKKGIPVYIGSLVSNIKDQPPFVSIQEGTQPPAQTIFDEANAAYSAKDYEIAKERFTYAKDLDGLKFRAPSQINEIIYALADEHENVRYVPVQETFEQSSENGLIGNNLILEHLHPNQKGYFLIGTSFAKVLLQDLDKQEIQNDTIDPDSYFSKMYLSDFDHRIVWHRMKTLKQGFPFVQTRRPSLYQLTYHPQDIVDSLAFMMVHSTTLWDNAKRELAKYYETHKDYDKALLEYHGLIRDQPWNNVPYILAARIHLDSNNFNAAYPLLLKAYEIEPKDAFTTKMLGAIELNRGNTKKAILLLEEAKKLNPNDAQMLYNLSGAYGTNQEFEKALEIANQVIALSPQFPGIQSWRQQLLTIVQNRKRN